MNFSALSLLTANGIRPYIMFECVVPADYVAGHGTPIDTTVSIYLTYEGKEAAVESICNSEGDWCYAIIHLHDEQGHAGYAFGSKLSSRPEVHRACEELSNRANLWLEHQMRSPSLSVKL